MEKPGLDINWGLGQSYDRQNLRRPLSTCTLECEEDKGLQICWPLFDDGNSTRGTDDFKSLG